MFWGAVIIKVEIVASMSVRSTSIEWTITCENCGQAKLLRL